MLCLECGAEMRLVHATKDTKMFVSGYEHHIWRCSSCPTVERRLTFSRERKLPQAVPGTPIQTVRLDHKRTELVEPIETGSPDSEPAAIGSKTDTWAKAVEKLRSVEERAAREAAAELARAVQFNRDWENKFRPVPPPSGSSGASN